MPTEPLLAEADVRAMVRLIGEVATIQGTHLDKKRYLMNGLCELIGADSWIWGLCCHTQPGVLPTFTSIANGGFTEENFAHFLMAQEHPDMARLTAPLFQEVETERRHLTRTRQQVDPEGRFLQSPVFALWRKADVGPILLSLRPLDEKSGSAVALYRKCERELFSPRESRIAHIILTEVPWLHEQGWPEDRGVRVPRLSPRQRVILNLLLEGQSRKAIAAHMGISVNTVHGYVREIYRFFDVQTHAYLIRRFQEGNGDEVAAEA